MLANSKGFERPKKIIISGGGTGGHLFPAVAIAEEFKIRNFQHSILFVGAIGKMEMNLIPKSGFKIKGLWIDGFHRKSFWRNLLLPLKVLISLWQSFVILEKFKPHVVIGTGGYASFPILKVAQWLNKPTVIQEQNALIGMTNKYLWTKAHKIFVAFDFKDIPAAKTKPINLGIPLRNKIHTNPPDRREVLKSLGLHSNKNVLLVLGGSLGAKAINEIIEKELGFIKKLNFQIIWQCGQLYAHQYTKYDHAAIKVMPFILDISRVYSLADIIICRAGASTIAELACVGKPTIFVPSPNVADNHQYHNAIWLQNHDAAILIEEKELAIKFKRVLGDLVGNLKWQKTLESNFKSFARPQATKEIVDEIQKDVL
ncbi:MAG: undecaprenyldiphospho-muramoylpentapeptide beta-N-acetylglucosaminyltransferase [Flavobacteriaceae bacterium]|nr:undecaprenyldiphospho-muramoylpentapeptide beta-N-acetylglucosaminyltransferase [Flavobacteriaceae bacterium]MCY4253331.1 undecaprenyldiphospho-muramoylpentapeptide beta-N-acetylglucosaminyltransferase [Flavobacteriaceae bacterium]